MTMFDASGTRLEFGAKLGEGGEGTVYEVRNNPTLVAKVYQKPLTREAEEKIRLMVAGGDQTLLSFAARRFYRRVPNAEARWILSDSQDL